MANIRHVVVLRKDLELTTGMVGAQCSHIADHFMRLRILEASKSFGNTNGAKFSPDETNWMDTPYISILAVKTKEELEYIRLEALENGLQVIDWYDVVELPSLKKPYKVLVGISIGPDDFDKISLVTKKLELY